MKVFLVGLLLVQSAICVLGGVPLTRGSCLKILNDARAELAKEYQIANMNDKMYEKKLEKNILSQLAINDGCPEPSVVKHDNFDIYLNVKGNQKLITELVSGSDSTTACVKSRCMENGNDIISVIVDSSVTPAINGPPGSKCSEDRSTNHNGLCALRYMRRGYTRKGLFDDILGGAEIILTGVEDTMKDVAEKTSIATQEVAGQANRLGKKMIGSATGKVVKETSGKIEKKMREKAMNEERDIIQNTGQRLANILL